LGDKSLTKTHEIINEFSSKMEWLKLLKQLNVEHKSEGKQTFKGLSRDSRFNMSYIGSKGIIDAHIDMNDTYDANWKQEYLPLLQIGITLWGISFENKQPISDKKLLSLLPEIQKNNPIKKTADINVTIGDKNFTTKISIGYDCAKHGVKAILEIPFKNDVFNDPASKIKTVTDQEMETYIDGSIVATLVFSNSTALLDDVESVLENCKKTLEQPGLFGDLKANRKLAEMLLGAFGQKTDPNKLKIQISYDTINQKINYDTAQNVGDVLSKMLSMVLGSSFGYNEHAHEDHADDVLHGLDTDHVKAAATTQAAIKTRSKKTSTHAVEKATRSTGTRSAGAITRPASH
jgi:hypothetical protein